MGDSNFERKVCPQPGVVPRRHHVACNPPPGLKSGSEGPSDPQQLLQVPGSLLRLTHLRSCWVSGMHLSIGFQVGVESSGTWLLFRLILDGTAVTTCYHDQPSIHASQWRGRLRQASAPDWGRESLPGRQPMKASLFAQMGYSERHKFPATWPVPPSYHDPAVTMQSYEDGLEECELAEEMGFDWISCSTPLLGQQTDTKPGGHGGRRIATVQEGTDRPVRATAAASQSGPGCRGDWDAGQPHRWPGNHGVPAGHPQ